MNDIVDFFFCVLELKCEEKCGFLSWLFGGVDDLFVLVVFVFVNGYLFVWVLFVIDG